MRVRQSIVGLVTVAAAAGATPATARADAPSIDARTWRPSTDPAAGLSLEPVLTPGPWSWNVGAWLEYAHHPVTLRKAGSDDVAFRPVEAQLGLHLVGNLGLGARSSVGLSVPTFLYQSGASDLPPTVATKGLPTSGVGDIGFHGKGVIVSNARDGGFGLAALGTLTLPTGSTASFAGEGAATVGVRLLAEYTLVVASIQASAGYTLRTVHRVWPDASAGGITFGDSIPWSVGVSLKPDVFKLDHSNRQRWDLAAHGSLPAGPVGPFGAGDPGSAQLSPVLLGLSDRVEIGHDRDAYVVVGAEVGLGSAVGVPAVRGVLSLGWAPRDHDMDHDGVPDDVDQCPEIPEDKDGFEDSDGCPEIDNDDDGILDKVDACPNVPGVPSADPKRNGCPAGDTDGDGIDDASDACPDVRGEKSGDPRRNGCPAAGDRDHDGVPDDVDRCPDQPEDKDGNADDDGCPDPDDDGDGIIDREDACPKLAGEASTDPSRNGCPNPDRDGDTYDDAIDQCPDAAEVWNGVKDDDGCPDEGGKPLVTIDRRGAHVLIRLASPIKLTGSAEAPEVDKSSGPTLRALTLELNRHREWTLAIGVRPGPGRLEEALAASLARASAIARAVGSLAHRESAAEAVAWDSVKTQPGSESGVGLLILVRAGVAPLPHAIAPLPPVAPADRPADGPVTR